MKNSADQGGLPLWITPTEICRILHIFQKPNSVIALLFIQNISLFLKELHHFALCFSTHRTVLSPGFLGHWFTIICTPKNVQYFWFYLFLLKQGTVVGLVCLDQVFFFVIT